MLAFTLIPILLVSIVAITITYKTMRDQLIYDHRMSSGWLQDRLAVENSDMMDRFYEFAPRMEAWITLPAGGSSQSRIQSSVWTATSIPSNYSIWRKMRC